MDDNGDTAKTWEKLGVDVGCGGLLRRSFSGHGEDVRPGET